MKDEWTAYFSMEIGIDAIPTYSGGLGVLAGDTILSAADLKVPMLALTVEKLWSLTRNLWWTWDDGATSLESLSLIG